MLYTGMTRNILARLYQHRHGLIEGFTKKYRVYKLVYYAETPSLREAIIREKQIKGGSRADKIALINGMNPTWDDLGIEILCRDKVFERKSRKAKPGDGRKI